MNISQEYIKKNISLDEAKFFINDSKNIIYKNTSKFNADNIIASIDTVLKALEEKDKIINLMAEYIEQDSDLDIGVCGHVSTDCNKIKCKECIKKYFENKVKESK